MSTLSTMTSIASVIATAARPRHCERSAAIQVSMSHHAFEPGLPRCARNDGVITCALLLSIGLHFMFFLTPHTEQQTAFQAPSGQKMAIQLAPLPKPSKLATIQKSEEVLITQAQEAQIQAAKPKPEPAPESKPVPKPELAEKLEELIVTREVKFSSKPISPVYPEQSRRKRQEGLVMVRAQVDDSGKTRAVKVSQSSGFPLLDKAALDAVGKWAFMPATQNGKTVTAWIEVPIDFKLR